MSTFKALKSSAEKRTFTYIVNPQTLFVLLSFNMIPINIFLKQVLANAILDNITMFRYQFSSFFHISLEIIINSSKACEQALLHEIQFPLQSRDE